MHSWSFVELVSAHTQSNRVEMSGERTRLACCRGRPRQHELFLLKNIAARRGNEHARRVRSPESCCNRQAGSDRLQSEAWESLLSASFCFPFLLWAPRTRVVARLVRGRGCDSA